VQNKKKPEKMLQGGLFSGDILRELVWKSYVDLSEFMSKTAGFSPETGIFYHLNTLQSGRSR